MWTLRNGLLFAKNLKIVNLIMELDAFTVVHNMKNSSINHSLEPILIDYENFLKTFSNWLLDHTHREANCQNLEILVMLLLFYFYLMQCMIIDMPLFYPRKIRFET